MTVAVSFPGIYIQEIPLSSHAITPAPTSIAAFVGYGHPYLPQPANAAAPASPGFAVAPPPNLGKATRIFSFTEFEAKFGGLFSSNLLDSSLARAVFNFFLNGGSDAWILAIPPKVQDSGAPATVFNFPSFTATVPTASGALPSGATMVFTALQPTDLVPMKVTIANPRNTASTSTTTFNTFDVIVSYGSRNETYRGIVLSDTANAGLPNPNPNAPDTRINSISTLVEVTLPPVSGSTLTALPNAGATSYSFNVVNPGGATTPLKPFLDQQALIAAFDVNSSLDKVEIFNLLVVPGVDGVTDSGVVSAALAFAERKRAFAILDPPATATADGTNPIDTAVANIPRSQNGALYFPYLLSTDPVTNTTISVPPSGFVAGIYARIDASRGVWKAPAGLETTLLNTIGPVTTGLMNDPQQGVLNKDAINALRAFTSIGTVVFGARTLEGADSNTAFPQSKYVPVRRMTLFIEQTLVANLKWVVFEPNDEPLWTAIRASIEAFLLSLFNQGALQGSTPSQAFQVKCDATTTTPTDQQNGIVNIVVAFAPLKPAEFVIIKISQLAGQAAS